MPTAFVAMPIKEAGSPEYLHFRALYDDVIHPCLEAAGFVPVRADDIQETGAVTKDIIGRLAEADLVVADLTDLNPNVFYELGIRHALRGSGTIMMLDRARTRGLPFDVMPYRAILFESDVSGIAKLRSELKTLAAGVPRRSAEHRDSPVHDAVAVLPLNVLANAAGTIDRVVSDELTLLRDRVRDYEKRFGVIANDARGTRSSPLDVIIETLGKADRGELPTDLVREAEEASRQHNTRTFLENVRKVLAQPGSGLESANEYVRLAQGARILGLIEVTHAIYEAGVEARPHDESLRASYLSQLAHSPDARARERARAELLTASGLTVGTDGRIEIGAQLENRILNRIGVMLDAYHADHLHEEALRIPSALVEHHPASSAAVRYHARALKETGAPRDQVDDWYRRAVMCPDVDDTSAQWFGTQLFNTERYVDAMEAYLLAAKLDPDDTAAFVDLLHAGAYARRRHLTDTHTQPRTLPAEIDTEFFGGALLCGFACSSVTQRQYNELLKHAELAEVDGQMIERGILQLSERASAKGYRERFEFARKYYDMLRSALTQEQ